MQNPQKLTEVRPQASTLASTETVCHSCLKMVGLDTLLSAISMRVSYSKTVQFTSLESISIPAIARVRLFDLRLPFALGCAALHRSHGLGFYADGGLDL